MDLDLFPRPHHIEVGGEGPAPGGPVTERPDPGLPAQGFGIDIGPDGVVVFHADEAGRRYGRRTLDQIVAQSPHRLPTLQLRDWPDFPVRGYMLDVSRNRVPTRATLERLVDLMALARINQFQLYTEHTFAYRDHEVVWRDASPITPEDIRWLDERCRAAGIELVPNQNCFGHMERWLAHPGYRHRAETPDGFEPVPGYPRPAAVLAPTQDNADFVLALLAELMPNFSSHRVNVGCDETFELGMGASRGAVEERGKAAVYVEHLRRIVGPLTASGREVQFWDDIVRRQPELLRTLPAGAVAVAWHYDAPGAPDQVREVLDRFGVDLPLAGFAELAPRIGETGFPFWVAPGTSSWNSLVGRIDNAVANLVDAASAGQEAGAGGFLITDWGDGGHLQPPSISFGPLLFGGAVSWALESNRGLDVAAELDHRVFADATGRLGGALDRLGRVWGATGQATFNGSPLDAALAPGGTGFVIGKAEAGKVAAVVEEIEQAMAAVEGAAPACTDGDVVRDEIVVAARLARHGAWRLLGKAGGAAPGPDRLAADLRETMDGVARTWHARSRPGGLDDSLSRLGSTLAGYG